MSSYLRLVMIPAIMVGLVFLSIALKPMIWPEQRMPSQSLKTLKTGTMINDPRSLQEFRLYDQNGFEMKPSSFKGQWSIFFFGYSSCPDFCPSILKKLDDIGLYIPDEHLKKYFVTIMPEQDTPDVLKKYLLSFTHHIHGLTGTRENIEALLSHFKLTAETEADYDGHIAHSAALVLVNPESKMSGIFHQISNNKDLIDDLYFIQSAYSQKRLS